MATNDLPLTTTRSRSRVRVAVVAVVGLLAVAGVACSSDADAPDTSEATVTTVDGEGSPGTTSDSTGTTATDDGDGSTTTVTGPTNDLGTAEASPEVIAYCDEIGEVANLIEDMQADPSNDAVNEVNARLAQLTEEATQLIEDHPDEVDTINDCAEALYAD